MLPILTTADDVRTIVRYLKNRPTGATIAEARAAIKQQSLDPRKLAAYQTWGFVAREADKVRLTDMGWDLARKPEREAEIFRSVLDRIGPYRSVLEWAHHQDLATATNAEVAAHWHEHHSAQLRTVNENTIKDMAVCFFHICEAAGLGILTIGRHGQATRLEVNREQLKMYIEAGPSAPPWIDASTPAAIADKGAESTAVPVPELEQPAPRVKKDPDSEKFRVFISHGKNQAVVEQITTILGLAGIDAEVAEKEETPAIPSRQSAERDASV